MGGREFDWPLTPVTDQSSGKSYLLDEEANIVFSQPHSSDWPKAVGRADRQGKLQLMEQRGEKGMFSAIDEYLKMNHLRFKQLFERSLTAGRDYLDINGLANLLRTVMPNVTNGEIYYFTVMCDVDGDGKIDFEELKETYQTTLEIEERQKSVSGMLPEVRSVMDMLARKLQSNPEAARTQFDHVDSKQHGYLTYPQFSLFLKRVRLYGYLPDSLTNVPILAAANP